MDEQKTEQNNAPETAPVNQEPVKPTIKLPLINNLAAYHIIFVSTVNGKMMLLRETLNSPQEVHAFLLKNQMELGTYMLLQGAALV